MKEAKITNSGHLFIPAKPKAGETILVSDYGHALVEAVYPSSIKLEFRDSLVGQFRQTFPFSVGSM